MLRIRKVADATTAVNRSAIEAAQKIMREQFPGMPDYDIAKLPEQLANPLKHRFVSRLFVAENARDQTLGLALLLHAPDIGFSYLELVSTAAGRMGEGIGATLYERVREEARALGTQLYFESLPDDPELSPNPEIRANNAKRLKFYERYGARPIVNTAYETPVTPGTSDPPYLLLDPLGANDLPSAREGEEGGARDPRAEIRIARRLCADGGRFHHRRSRSVLREPRYVKSRRAPKGEVRASSEPRIALVLNDDHTIHHVQDRGYVEAPVRIRSIMAELDASGLFEKMPAKRYSDRHIRAVHDGRLVDYIRKACLMAGPKKSIYPYVFPTRNPARAPKDETVLAGYYCIDTFTPLNQNAYLAARSAVDCALTAAERVLEGAELAYALVRPPGHHAETRTFGGFCYFNNAAIAANMLSRYGKVAILDVDYHHGNGQQEIFYARSDVLTVSMHGHPSFAYPYFTGFRDETGIGPGAGFNLNIPLPEHLTPDQHRNAVAEGLRRVRRFRPTFLVVSLGFDTARGDPTGTWSNRARDFERLGHMIGEQGYSTLVVQEGGYRVRTLGCQCPQLLRRPGHRTLGGAADGADPQPERGRKAASPQRARLAERRDGRRRGPRALAGREHRHVQRGRGGHRRRARHRAPHQGHPLGLSLHPRRARVRARGLRLLRPDRGHARLVRSLLDCRLAGRAAEGARRPGLCPRRVRDAQGRRQAHLCRYLVVRPLRADARLLSAHGLRRGGAAARLLRRRRRQGHLCEVALLASRSAVAVIPAKAGIQESRLSELAPRAEERPKGASRSTSSTAVERPPQGEDECDGFLACAGMTLT